MIRFCLSEVDAPPGKLYMRRTKKGVDQDWAAGYNYKDLSTQEGGAKLANELGKRYFCEKCGTEFIVTKRGEGKLTCCGQPMTLKK